MIGFIIDLRSDTVTKPSAAMRKAMAEAEVGDDVYGEDPTVAALEQRAAALLGKEAGLFVPSGSMANQIALQLFCRPGEEVVIGEGSHNYFYEAGAAGALAGVQFSIVGQGGTFTAAEAAAVFKPEVNHSLAPTRMICVENTHNRGGGVIWDPAAVEELAALAREHGLALHLDGARLANAAVASGRSLATLAAPFDTVSMCFSKGLGAPVGSVLCGSRAHRHRAHRIRKMLGGGMRQAGILAAGALWALEHNVERLAEDHANARLIGERLARQPGLQVDVARLQTNIVLCDLEAGLPEAEAFVARLRERGVLCLAIGQRRLRLLTHLDVSRADCERAADIICETAGRSAHPSERQP